MFKCTIGACEKFFATISNLNRHKRCDHKVSGRQVTAFEYDAYSAKCVTCRLSFRFVSDLRDHNWSQHKIPIEVENLEFADDEQFAVWKDDVQRESKTDFVKSAGNKKGVVYYYCSRTARRGKQSEKRRKRQPKLQGNGKLSFSCTCQMKVCQTDDGRFKVTYFKTHYGHEIEIEHTRLPKDVRGDVAEKLANGISVARILDSYRDGIGGNAKRSDFLTRKDVNNIRASCNLRGSADEDKSLETWLNDCSKLPENPVLLYKPSGEDFEGLDKDDFVLGIMNETQKHVLQRVGRGIISIDTTRDNNSNFQLTSLMVTDESGESFPGAFLFSNRNDSITYEKFFHSIREKVGVVKIAVFMSDVDVGCYSSWAEVMGCADKHIYSPWHVDRMWRTKLQMIVDLEKRSVVYTSLKAMQRERNEQAFHILLHKFVGSVADDVGTKTFGEYFNNTFCGSVERWASCCQRDCPHDVVTRLENMQRVVRGVFAEGGGSLDSTVNAVMRVLRNMVLHRLTKETKRSVSVGLGRIRSRHRRALGESLGRVTRIADGAWRVSSVVSHSVVKGVGHDCVGARCEDCRVCRSCYQCTCTDFCLKSTICKHIHLVAIKEASHSGT